MSMILFGIYLAICGYILYRVTTWPDDWWR
jgi:hypothetical protein